MTTTQDTKPYRDKKVLQTISDMWANYRYRESHLNARQCILATRFASVMLTLAGIEHEVVPVGVCVFNQKGWNFAKTNTPFTKDGDEWTVKLSVDNPVALGSDDKCGHVVIITENFYYDPSSEQLSRPKRQMEIPNSIIRSVNKMSELDESFVLAKQMFRPNRVFHFPVMSSHYTWTVERHNTNYNKGNLCWEQTPEEVIQRLGFDVQKAKDEVMDGE